MTEIKAANSEPMVVCPRCGQSNNISRFFCYYCGKYFVDRQEVKTGWAPAKQGKEASPPPVQKAKMVMPGGNEITFAGTPVFIERSDFDSTLPHDLLMCISRQHVLITCSKGKYYITDYGRDGKGSTNHTRLNGVDIHDKKKKLLNDGDSIELAGQPELTMMFRLIPEQEKKKDE